MSRKANADRSGWNTASLYAFVGGYGPFKPRGPEPIENAVVVFQHAKPSTNSTGFSHPMHNLAGQAQEVLLRQQTGWDTILVLDLTTMVQASSTASSQDDSEASEEGLAAALKREATELELTKGFGRTLLRLLERLRLHQATFVAYLECCPLLIKLVRALPPEVCQAMWLLHPVLPPKFVNLHLVGKRNGNKQKLKGKQNQNPTLNLVFESELARDRRLDMLRHIYPQGSVQLLDDKLVQTLLLRSIIMQENSGSEEQALLTPTYNPDYCNEMGQSLFLSSVTVEMSKYTKQYERNAEDTTSDLLQRQQFATPADQGASSLDPAAIDWSSAERHVGALVLRGNRCVLVRSLKGAWQGMKIPSLKPNENESPHDTAVRCVVHFTGVDEKEVQPLLEVPPVEVFHQNLLNENGGAQPTRIQVYALYATEPPPDGPLEDADLEDEESEYDWFTAPNAIKKLDPRSVAGLLTMSVILIERANLHLVPCKWGGVFGQELQMTMKEDNGNATTISTIAAPVLTSLTAGVEEWKPSRQGDVLQEVRKANESLMQKIRNSSSTTTTAKKLPVTLLSGFLGSGKTTLLSHILTNYSGLKVAILVNDMGEINIDAALVKNSSIRQQEEHMISLDNGCICCTLREDLLTEVAKIAGEGTFDYLLIESSGISEPLPVAETFTFEDSTGLRLGDIAEIDTLVTVVDGSRFLSELDSLESLRERDWQADAQDERTISHLLCDQVEFANVIVLNKCDLMSAVEKEKVKGLIQSMNPQAKLVESTFSKVPLDTVLGTNLFSMKEAERHEGWLQEARIGEHTPETEEYGISSFTFRALKPFKPKKLYEALEAMLAKTSPPYKESVVLRAKGFLWFANCPQLQGEFSLAGHHYSVLPGNPWWVEIDKADWPPNLERDIAPLWHEPYGDRQQEIVIIGQSLDKEGITQSLEACLVSEEEMAKGQEAWYELCNQEGDPFAEAWDAAIQTAMAAHDHEHEHDHGHSHGHEHSHDQ